MSSNTDMSNSVTSSNLTQEKIIRSSHDRENPFAQISRSLLRDNSLSFRARGLLCYMLSFPNNWEAHPQFIAKEAGIGKDQMYSILKELIESGYCRYHQPRQNETGRFQSGWYEFSESRIFKKSLPNTGFPEAVMPNLEKTDLKNNVANNKNNVKQQQAAVVFDCLKDLKIPESEKSWLSQHYQESDLNKAVAWATAPTTKITKTLEQALKWWLKQQIKPVAGETDEQRAHNLRKFSCDLESKIESSQAKYLALNDHTEIITTTTTICFDYNDRDFAEKQAKALAKYGFVKMK